MQSSNWRKMISRLRSWVKNARLICRKWPIDSKTCRLGRGNLPIQMQSCRFSRKPADSDGESGRFKQRLCPIQGKSVRLEVGKCPIQTAKIADSDAKLPAETAKPADSGRKLPIRRNSKLSPAQTSCIRFPRRHIPRDIGRRVTSGRQFNTLRRFTTNWSQTRYSVLPIS